MGEVILEMKGIDKSFPGVHALDHVDLEIRKGEVLALMGENGAGKSTLMSMLFGMYEPDEGEIYVDGKEVTIASPKDSFALGIGMIHQHFKLVDVLTAAENIILGLPGKEVLKMDDYIKGISEKIQDTFSAYYVVIGLDYGIACEACLKLKEISYVNAEAYCAG